MNEATLFLSQLIGPILLIGGISMLVRQDAYREFIQNLAKNRALLLYNGFVESTAGLAVILYHNLWSTPAEIIISLIGWGMFAEGIFDLFVSKKTIKSFAISSTGYLQISAWVLLAIGAYLSYVAYLVL